MLFFSILILLSCSTQAVAAPYMPSLTFNDVMSLFLQGIDLLEATIIEFASRTLYFCGIVAMILAGSSILFYQSMFRHSIPLLLITFLRVLMLMGILKLLIQHGSELSRDFLNSFIALPGLQFGNISVSTLINEYLQLIEDFADILANQNTAIFTIFLIINFILVCAFIIFLMLNYLMATFACTLCTLLLGFAILRFFRSFLVNYISILFTYCIKLFAMFFIFNLGHNIMLSMVVSMQSQVNAGIVIRIQDLSMMTFVMAFLLALTYACSKLPHFLVRLQHVRIIYHR